MFRWLRLWYLRWEIAEVEKDLRQHEDVIPRLILHKHHLEEKEAQLRGGKSIPPFVFNVKKKVTNVL